MKRKKLLLIVLAVVLLTTALVFQAALAQESEPLLVIAHADGATFYADADQPLLIGTGWIATTKGQLQVYRNHSYQTFALTGPEGTIFDLSADESEAYWGPFDPYPFDDSDCPMPTIWWNLWGYVQEPLPPGEYRLEYTNVITQPANDGFHTCLVDGEAVPPPSLYRPGEPFVSTVTIVVSGP